jgi:hypothetical protein
VTRIGRAALSRCTLPLALIAARIVELTSAPGASEFAITRGAAHALRVLADATGLIVLRHSLHQRDMHRSVPCSGTNAAGSRSRRCSAPRYAGAWLTICPPGGSVLCRR